MVDPVSATTAIASLLVTLTKVVNQCNGIRGKYKSAEWGIGNIASECSVVKAALGQLQALIDGMDTETWKAEQNDGHIIASLDEVTIACASTFSLLTEYLAEAVAPNNDDDNDSPSHASSTSGPSRKQRANFVWNEDQVQGFMAQLRGHQSSLTLLLTVVQIRSEQDTRRILREQRDLILDLRRMLVMPAPNDYRMSILSGDTFQGVAEKIQAPVAPEGLSTREQRQIVANDPSTTSRDTAEEVTDPVTVAASAVPNEDSETQLIGFKSVITPVHETSESGRSKSSDIARTLMPRAAAELSVQPNLTATASITPPSLEHQLSLTGMHVPTASRASDLKSQRHAVSATKTIRCVVVGDKICGKTELIMSYTTGSFPSDYVPTVFDNYAVKIKVGNTPYTLALFDTVGQEDYDRLRPLTYPTTDVFILLFSLVDHTSFENARIKWFPELRYHMPGTPIVLAGVCKSLRDDPNSSKKIDINDGQTPVRTHEGMELARFVSATKYVECDALTGENVEMVFNEAVAAALKPKMMVRKSIRSMLGSRRRSPE